MTSQEFCFWLHGFFEIGGKSEITAEQAQIIKDHLELVFTKVTPERQSNAPHFPNQWQSLQSPSLQAIHDQVRVTC
jgi:beta-xylosidase